MTDDLDVPPQRIELDRVVLRRMAPDDAESVAAAVTESYDHIQPWMPWATPESTSPEFQRRRLAGPAGSWELDGDYAYGIFLPSSDTHSSDAVAGGAGLHRRLGPGALEIGYWVHVAHIRTGIATAAAGALTSAGFSMAGIERIEIRCDAANDASAAVPRKLGFRLVDSLEIAPEAPAEVGRRLVWEITKDEWRSQGRESPRS